ncbi:fatty acid desaturase [Roseobacter denitrificans]|uniref:Fatty acid desaturase, putative n=1 Tax=Roseobacter denitrificans (strain ATCC 33942 / OCh 114) TaxID=375451 RepID=Q16BI9_ROSDO|nr:fatty acid desaturase [Roseobacter denitrificans]ABG30654.1 fatty acid desaturase, putative [Roseobacter denitrificans OCh 114]AVL53783.1 fatty acid desaturase [Roseobacter denitrificans]SFG18944.1 omega-6 fatty acid desaturase (delta-12 desaturase) [Roseobacter denitrificans OCh 114]
MTSETPFREATPVSPSPGTSAGWVRILAQYREPKLGRSIFEVIVTLAPFIAIWAVAWLLIPVSYLASFALACLNGLFLVRLFCIQHDCGHGSFFAHRGLSDWLGRGLGVLTLTPYDVWRKSHSMHHSGAGNLERRGIGDVMTLTVDEYHARSVFGRLRYRAYRNPIVLFLLGPAYVFYVENRLPLGQMDGGWRVWVSSLGTTLLAVLLLAAIVWFGGLLPVLLIFVPTTMVAATLGVWLFYVQHQFEETHWDQHDDWDMYDSALHGSSHYVMPTWLQWFTANIGIHHVHHLYSRIPFYRLTEVLRDHRELAQAQRLSISESLASARLHLWDEKQRRLLSFAEAQRVYRAA